MQTADLLARVSKPRAKSLHSPADHVNIEHTRTLETRLCTAKPSITLITAEALLLHVVDGFDSGTYL